MSGSANVSIGGYRKDQQMSGSANVQVESANGRLAEISKCLSQQMSKPSQQKSRQQMSVSKSPVGKWKIGVSSNTKKFVLATIPSFVVGDNDILSCRLQTLQQNREKGTIGAPAVRKVVEAKVPRSQRHHLFWMSIKLQSSLVCFGSFNWSIYEQRNEVYSSLFLPKQRPSRLRVFL